MLKALQEWICDTCGDLIKQPEHGYVEWLCSTRPKYEVYGFRIGHHAPRSPRHPHGDCYKCTDNDGRLDASLSEFVGRDGLILLLLKVDPGPYHMPDYKSPPVRDLREWAELVRRLQFPHYEEARRYWKAAKDDGFFDGANEMLVYSAGMLKAIIKQYGGRT